MSFRISILFVLFISASISGLAQNTVNVYGIVSDLKTGELLQAATIKNNNNLQNSGISNVYGYYLIHVEAGKMVTIEASYVGYKSNLFNLNLLSDTILNIKLEPGVQLGEFTISASEISKSSLTQIGKMELSAEAIKYTPSLAGESNIMMALKTLPGVSAGKEGSSELFVRGGSHDQNLILLDKSPVYNLNHAFGLLSVFNSSALKNVSLHKGGISSEYGGRLSSVLDVSVKEGNRKDLSGDFSISTIAATATIEGPIVKDNASFLISARRSWPDIFVSGISKANNDDMAIGYNFMDVNAKTNFSLKKKHHFYLSIYTGQDKLFAKSDTDSQKSEMTQGWGNTIASARYQSASGNGSFNEALVYFSSYNESDLNRIHSLENKSSQENRSELKEFGFKTSKDLGLGQNLSIKFGVDGLYRSIQPPFKLLVANGIENQIKNSQTVHQKELSAFASSSYSPGKFNIQFGLRTSMFGEQLTDNFFIEPRLSIIHKASKALSLKMGAMRNTQSVFAMSKSIQGMPAYTWLPATGNLKPQLSWQTSAGVNWQKGKFNIDAEAYYKWMENIAGNYLYPSNLYQSLQWHDIIEQGKGRAYGFDVLSQFKSRQLQVNFKYSLSKTEHSFSSFLNGQWIPANYDIRHDFSLTGAWSVQENEQRKKWFLGNFALHSGSPITLPTLSIKSMMPVHNEENYEFDFSHLDYYNQPNNARTKLYHRLDFGFNMQKTQTKGFRTWSLGIINVYNRKNPYSIYKDGNGNFKQLVLFPIMPFVSFKKSF